MAFKARKAVRAGNRFRRLFVVVSWLHGPDGGPKSCQKRELHAKHKTLWKLLENPAGRNRGGIAPAIPWRVRGRKACRCHGHHAADQHSSKHGGRPKLTGTFRTSRAARSARTFGFPGTVRVARSKRTSWRFGIVWQVSNGPAIDLMDTIGHGFARIRGRSCRM